MQTRLRHENEHRMTLTIIPSLMANRDGLKWEAGHQNPSPSRNSTRKENPQKEIFFMPYKMASRQLIVKGNLACLTL